MGFWSNFWNNFKALGNDKTESDRRAVANVQKWEDYQHYNPLDIVVNKLSILANDEATFDVQSDSTLAEPLFKLCEDIESKRYEICLTMLGKGGCYLTMANDEKGQAYHRILKPDDVSVYTVAADKITEVALIIERKYVNEKEYKLIRHHLLDTDGSLYIYYYTTDKDGRKTYLADWERYNYEAVKFINANNIGLSYFKSPQNSRGLETFFGVPFNFGCEEIEKQIRADRKALEGEMKKAQMKLFVDKSITRMEHTEDGRRYGMPEDMFVIQKKAGVDGGLIDEFAPTTRFNDYKAKLDLSCAEYENQMGLNKGFLTEAEITRNATATEIRTANVKTISMVKKVQSAMYDGLKALLTSDSILLGIHVDLWELAVDWYDAFENTDAQFNRIFESAQNGYAEAEDVVRWVFPTLTPEEIAEKLERISATKQINTDQALERILAGQ